MNIACAIAVGAFCIPATYAPTVHTYSMITHTDKFDPGVARLLGVKLDLFDSDNLHSALPANLDSVCVDSTCVYYRKYCTETYRACDFVAGTASIIDLYRTPKPPFIYTKGLGVYLNVFLEITATSPEALHRAERAIAVVADDGKGKSVQVSLSSLERQSEKAETLACSIFTTSVRGCNGNR
ncbi:MAG: hypothetical protein ABSD74_13800 [Rhizomicrobium sp.]|jgi:hypothetical protein